MDDYGRYEEIQFVLQLNHPQEDLGFEYECETYPGELGEMRLLRMTPGGPCYRARVPPGTLLTLNNRPVHSVADLRAAVRAVRQQQTLEFELTMVPDEDDWQDRRRPRRSRRDSRYRRGSRYRSGSHRRYADPSLPPDYHGRDFDSSLAEQLRSLAVQRRQGQLGEGAYRMQKRKILGMLSDDAMQPMVPPQPIVPAGGIHLRASAPGPPPSVLPPGAATSPPSPWARVLIPRYVFLRSAPYKGADYVAAPGVTGVVGVAHIHGKFALLNHPQIGYIQTKYLQFLPHHDPLQALSPVHQRSVSPMGPLAQLAPQQSHISHDAEFQELLAQVAAQQNASSVPPPPQILPASALAQHPSYPTPGAIGAFGSLSQFDARPSTTSEGSPLATGAIHNPITPGGSSWGGRSRVPSPLPEGGAVDWGDADLHHARPHHLDLQQAWANADPLGLQTTIGGPPSLPTHAGPQPYSQFALR